MWISAKKCIALLSMVQKYVALRKKNKVSIMCRIVQSQICQIECSTVNIALTSLTTILGTSVTILKLNLFKNDAAFLVVLHFYFSSFDFAWSDIVLSNEYSLSYIKQILKKTIPWGRLSIIYHTVQNSAIKILFNGRNNNEALKIATKNVPYFCVCAWIRLHFVTFIAVNVFNV